MSTPYYPHESFIDYFNNNDRQVSFSDDELVKFVEIFHKIINMGMNDDPRIKHSSLEVIEQRKTVCASCTHYNKGRDSCKICGCVIKNKVLNPTESCPIHFWSLDTTFFKNLIVELGNEMEQFLKDNPDVIPIEEYQRTFEPTSSETNE